MSTRAIHLELVSDYTSDVFLASYRRFTARRGLPEHVYSDNGTTFQGAEKELQAAYKAALTDVNTENTIDTDRTTWHFMPPGAPHFGGLWEAGGKCAKHYLKRVLGTNTLTYEEFSTLTSAQVKVCLNSRPIGPLLTDPCEFSALTPGHFLIGDPLLNVPEPSLLTFNKSRLSRWQFIQQKVESFWKRWTMSEYFHSLQTRNKWRSHQENIAVGNLVLIRNNNLPPIKWMLGRVIEVHPGSDNNVRVVTLRTATSELKRPITQICLLPIDSDQRTEPTTPLHPDGLDTTSFSDFQYCDETVETNSDD
ncbi:uncharacterized protein LOC143898908 [Temnothorax americanus]|uniref:uncharacterized protein LOC143898908 n=1 Tax=Temnothorax americanus TaxID=1964332 RepID=UPI004067A54E